MEEFRWNEFTIGYEWGDRNTNELGEGIEVYTSIAKDGGNPPNTPTGYHFAVTYPGTQEKIEEVLIPYLTTIYRV